MNRLDISFTSDSQTCAGWFYPADVEGPAPCIVMAHGLAAVKEMRLDAYAERFSAAGYHFRALYRCLTFAVTRRLPRRPVRSRGIYGDRAELRQRP